MPYREKSLRCVDCGKTFAFTAEEQTFYASKGLTDPKRCLACRAKRKAAFYSHNEATIVPPRRMFTAICAECGKETRVPFQPRIGRPIYCLDCYHKKKNINSPKPIL